MSSEVTRALPSVSIVIPARNAERTLGECLSSMARLDYPEERRELIVVDNGSTDSTVEIAAGFPVRIVGEGERGRSQARNRGIAESRGEIVAFTDADCMATTGWLRELASGFEEQDVWGVAGEIVAYPPSTAVERYVAAIHAHWQRDVLALSRPFVATPSAAFRRQTFDRIGFFDPALPRAQDKDFGWRLLAAGMKVHYSPRAVVFHRHPPTGWALLRQHAGWGYGAALLHAKHDLPWSLREELGKYSELAGALGALARAGARYGIGDSDRSDLEYRYCEFLRRLGLRAGALRGFLTKANPMGSLLK